MGRAHLYGEIIWPEGFRICTERYFESLVDDGLSYGYIKKSKKIIKDLILIWMNRIYLGLHLLLSNIMTHL